MLRKRILRLVGQNGGGGARIHVWQINTHLHQLGYDVTTVIPRPSFVDPFTKEGLVELQYINTSGLLDFLSVSIKCSFNSAIVHSHLRNANLLGFLICFIFRIKHVITIHTPVISNTKGVKESLYRTALKQALKRADLTIFISEYIKIDTLSRLGLSDTLVKSIVIYNGSTDHGLLKNRDEDVFIICLIGELSDRKGIADFLEIARLVQLKGLRKKLEFRVFGEGPWKERLIEYSNEIDSIKVLGYETNPQLMFAGSSLNLMLGKNEAFGRTITEAKSFGIPSLCWNAGAFPELITPWVDGFLVNSSSEAADVIEYLSINSEILRDASRQARLDYEKRFSEHTFVSKTQAAICEVLNK